MSQNIISANDHLKNATAAADPNNESNGTLQAGVTTRSGMTGAVSPSAHLNPAAPTTKTTAGTKGKARAKPSALAQGEKDTENGKGPAKTQEALPKTTELMNLLGDGNESDVTSEPEIVVKHTSEGRKEMGREDEARTVALEAALKAAKEGDHDKSDLYFGIYASLGASIKQTRMLGKPPKSDVLNLDELFPEADTPSIKTPPSKEQPPVSIQIPTIQVSSMAAAIAASIPSSNRLVRPADDPEDAPVGGISFLWEAVNSNADVGFTPYFDKNIRELRGPIPSTIFNKKWQDAAIAHHADKRPKYEEGGAEKTTRYTGYPYPSEWTQTFCEWTMNHRDFHTIMRDCYSFVRLAEWILLHKANTDAIQRKEGFLVAFRYDIQVRANAFAHRVLINGKSSFSNISVLRQDILEEVYADARRHDELSFTDNPYAPGGPRANWDPSTGKPRPSTKATAPKQQNQLQPPANTNSQPSGSSLPQRPANSRGPRGSGYRGNRYDENYDQRYRKPGNKNDSGNQ
ncbi:hypothetical protein MJO29_008584 [Puccinia striiformis f. sp. tritici]|nr:hypothetical protein MJO29_008584 [Puccinia striiformis f. sp. tritici]